MKIYKKGKKIIVELDFLQEGEGSYGNERWEEKNLIGVISDEEITISQQIYLDYKDSLQEGMPIINYCLQPTKEEKESFIKLCGKLGIDVWEHPSCNKCKKTIRGSHTIDKEGPLCFDCEHKKKDEI